MLAKHQTPTKEPHENSRDDRPLPLRFCVYPFRTEWIFHFLPQPPPSNPLAVQYFTVLITSHYMVLVFLVQLVGGLLLLANRFVPLALTILAPVLVNILLFHSLMDQGGIAPGLLCSLMWIFLFTRYRRAFDGILETTPSPVDERRTTGWRPDPSRAHHPVA